MSDCWRVPILEYLRMSHGRKEPEYGLHSFNISDGMVIFRTKRERKLLEDVIAWANDKVLPDRPPTTGEPRKKKAKASDESNGPTIGSILLQHPHLLTNLRPKTAPWLQALCPSCASIGKDSDENHFYIHEEQGGYGCVAGCGTGDDLTRALVKILADAGLSVNDTRQNEKTVEKTQITSTPSDSDLLAVRPIGKDPMSKKAANDSVVSFTTNSKKVLSHIFCTKGGVTDEEGQDTLGLAGNSYRPARGALVKLGFVMKSGETRETHSGSSANVWVATMSPGQAELEWDIIKQEGALS